MIKNYFNLITENILNTKTIQHSGITMLGTILNGILGVIFFLILARNLGPANFGIFSVSVTFLTLLSDIADLGVNSGMINFVGKNFKTDPQKADQFLKVGLIIKFVVWIAVLGIGFISLPFITTSLFSKSELINPLRLALFGVGGAMLFSFITNSLQAMQKYWTWGVLNIGSNLFRLISIIFLISALNLNLENALISYTVALFSGFLIGILFLPKRFLSSNPSKLVVHDLLQFNKWMTLFLVCAAVGARLDTFISAKFVSNSELGFYAVANQLTSIIPQLVFALAASIAPKLAGYSDNLQAKVYLKKVLFLVLGIAAIGILFLPIFSYLIPLFYGFEYKRSVGPFIILFISQLIFLITIPATQAILYYFSKPKILATLAIIQVIIMALLGIFLIKNFGISGAAVSILITNVSIFVISGAWVLILFKRGK